MSHPINTIYLEDMHERFSTSKNGFERCSLLEELRQKGFKSAVETLIGEWYIEQSTFLNATGVTEDELLQDEDDATVLFWYEDVELGTPGDDYQITREKIELPTYLNVDYWLDYKNLKNT